MSEVPSLERIHQFFSLTGRLYIIQETNSKFFQVPFKITSQGTSRSSLGKPDQVTSQRSCKIQNGGWKRYRTNSNIKIFPSPFQGQISRYIFQGHLSVNMQNSEKRGGVRKKSRAHNESYSGSFSKSYWGERYTEERSLKNLKISKGHLLANLSKL